MIFLPFQEAANSIYEHHCNSVQCQLTDHVVGYNELMQSCKQICPDARSFEVALMELCCQKRCVVGVGSNGEKVGKPFMMFAAECSYIVFIQMQNYLLLNEMGKVINAC